MNGRVRNGVYEDVSENPCELATEDSYKNLIESIMYRVDRLAEFEGKSASSCSRGYSEIVRAYMNKSPDDCKIKFDAGELDLFELAKLQRDGYISSFACYIDRTEIELTVECNKRLRYISNIKALLGLLK